MPSTKFKKPSNSDKTVISTLNVEKTIIKHPQSNKTKLDKMQNLINKHSKISKGIDITMDCLTNKNYTDETFELATMQYISSSFSKISANVKNDINHLPEDPVDCLGNIVKGLN